MTQQPEIGKPMDSPIQGSPGQLSRQQFRVHVILATALIAQVACWLLATPGPFLHGQPTSFASATTSVIVALGCLFVFPLVVARFLGIKISTLGIQFGDWKYGLVLVAIAIPVAGISLFFGCNDAEIMMTYPWTGRWLSLSTSNMLAWFAIYSMYYLAFEFFYRGFLLKGLELEIGLATAMWIQVIMSVTIHFGKPMPELVASIPAGFLFGWIAYRTKSIVYVFAIHWAVGIFNDLFAMYYKDWLS